MNKSESIAVLAKALSAAQSEFENPSKNATNPHFHSKYADLAELVNVVRPVLSRHGLSITQWPGFVDGLCTVETVLMHQSGEWLSGVSSTPVTKQDPQGIGSATTYLRRYSMAAICGLAQEDDDGNTASKPRRQQTITDEQIQQIRERLAATGGNESKFLRYLKLTSLSDMPAQNFESCIATINSAAEKRNNQ